jgi:hypothetical protein
MATLKGIHTEPSRLSSYHDPIQTRLGNLDKEGNP